MSAHSEKDPGIIFRRIIPLSLVMIMRMSQPTVSLSESRRSLPQRVTCQTSTLVSVIRS